MSSAEEAVERFRSSGGDVLDLSGIRGQIPEEVWLLHDLRGLVLRGCGIRFLPSRLRYLRMLESLDLSGNGLDELPLEILDLPNLRRLHLSENDLAELPGKIARLPLLEHLDLADNRLSTLPDELGTLKNLGTLVVAGNPLDRLPAAVVAGGTETILSFLRGRLGTEGERQWISKMIIVGEAAVGKTSLARMLAAEGFDPKEPQTHGISTRDLGFAHPEQADVKMTMHTWDFGGQQIYHATHRFFLTDRALFLVVFSSRDGYTKGQLRTWLQAVTARAPQSPILLVATHSDEHPATLPLQSLRAEFPRIVDFVEIDSETGTGERHLRSAIAEAAARLPLMGNRWPKTWIAAAAALKAEGETQAYITPRSMRERMAEAGLEPHEHGLVAGVLHSLGDLLYYPDERELGDYVVVRPVWVNDKITKILDNKDLLALHGVLRKNLLARLWSDLDEPVQDFLVGLMEHVDLAYRVDSEDRNAVCLVVEKLSEDPADYHDNWWAARSFPEIKLVYDFSQFVSLQAGIPTWFIAREHRFTADCHWRNGVLLHSHQESAWALLTADPLARTVELTVRGPYPVAFFSQLKASFERILTDRYPGVPYQLLVPCPCRRKQAQPCAHVFEYDDLRRRMHPSINKPFIECHKSLKDVYVPSMIAGFDAQPLEKIQLDIETMGAKIDRIDARQQLMLDFLRSITERQRLQEVQCPSVFLITSERKGVGRQHEFRLRFCCEYSHQWHPIEGKQAVLTFRRPAAWFEPIAPHLRTLVHVLQQLLPVVGDVAGALSFPLSATILSEISLMKDFVALFPEGEAAPGHNGFRPGGPSRVAHHEGDFRWLAAALHELDPSEYWGGLTKTTTPDGLTVYVCRTHLKELRYPAI